MSGAVHRRDGVGKVAGTPALGGVLGAVIAFLLVQLAPAPKCNAMTPPLPGHSKVMVDGVLYQPNASSPPTIAIEGVTFLEAYSSYALGTVAWEDIDRVRNEAAERRAWLQVFDFYDLLGLPGRLLDTRLGLVTAPGDQIAEEYPEGKYGLYALQFIGPPKQEWFINIAAAGGVAVESIPLNGMLVALTPDGAARVRDLREVQFLEVLHPFLKSGRLNLDATTPLDVLVAIAECPDTHETIAVVTAILGGDVREQRDRYTFYLSGKLDVTLLPQLVADRLVIGVYPLGGSTISGPVPPPPSSIREIPALTGWSWWMLVVGLAVVAIIRLQAFRG